MLENIKAISVGNIENIKAIFALATPNEILDGVTWYARAQTDAKNISLKYNVPLDRVVGVIAALSPNNKWERNVINADDLIGAYINGDPMESVKVSTYNKMKEKAWLVLADQFDDNSPSIPERLNGQKIKSFYGCIMGFDECCIDGHALNIWRNQRTGLTSASTNIGKKLYAEIQNDYIDAASDTEFLAKNSFNTRPLKAYEMQAITWVTWRRIHNIT
tara:strand:+ start:923 stop:1576 length:654 start_codon:yes stop_codon:yes gene_type:complete